MNVEEGTETTPPVVRLFRQILIWPLLLKDVRDGSSGRDLLDRWADSLRSANGASGDHIWKKLECKDEPFEEVVYFHPFVRDFLYGDAQTPPAIQVFQRNDIKAVCLDLGFDPFELKVTRVQLYGFDTGIVLFVIEVEHRMSSEGETNRLTLDVAKLETILDEFRRAYPPYWERRKCGSRVAARFPRSVTWVCDGGIKGPFKPAENDLRDFVKKGAEPPVAGHWLELLDPLLPYQGNTEQDRRKLTVQQIEDERIPSMCYLVFDNPRALTKGDMTRIGLLDDQGSPDTLPYSRPFLADFDEQYCFDAFWGPRTPKAARCEATMAGQPSAPAPWWTTRYMCCGYGFTVLGCDDQGKFFTNEENGVYFHFDHHYFKIGLIAHFHRASLLMFSERLSNAVKVLDPGPRGPDPDRYKKLRKEVQTIQDDFLRFRSRYWFTEVSNHLQPRILFDLWSRHLNTRELFAEVLDEAQTINDVLDAREQEKQTAESVRLSVVATVGLAASIAVNSFALYGVKNCEGFTEFSLVVAILIYVGAFLVIAFSGPLGATFKKLAGEGEKQWKDRASGGTALESPQPVPSHSFTTDQQQ